MKNLITAVLLGLILGLVPAVAQGGGMPHRLDEIKDMIEALDEKVDDLTVESAPQAIEECQTIDSPGSYALNANLAASGDCT